MTGAVPGAAMKRHMRLVGRPAGLLFNINTLFLKEGVKRIVNGHRPSASSRLRVNQLPLKT